MMKIVTLTPAEQFEAKTKTGVTLQAVLDEIVRRIVKVAAPEKIILFGSAARGEIGPDSDIDLLVVLNSEYYPQSYKEKSDLYLQVSRTIRDIRQQIPVDLIVHTRPMHKKFIELNSMFAQEILQKGRILYEADNQSLVSQREEYEEQFLYTRGIE